MTEITLHENPFTAAEQVVALAANPRDVVAALRARCEALSDAALLDEARRRVTDTVKGLDLSHQNDWWGACFHDALDHEIERAARRAGGLALDSIEGGVFGLFLPEEKPLIRYLWERIREFETPERAVRWCKNCGTARSWPGLTYSRDVYQHIATWGRAIDLALAQMYEAAKAPIEIESLTDLLRRVLAHYAKALGREIALFTDLPQED